jgi:hypothetical protein
MGRKKKKTSIILKFHQNYSIKVIRFFIIIFNFHFFKNTQHRDKLF